MNSFLYSMKNCDVFNYAIYCAIPAGGKMLSESKRLQTDYSEVEDVSLLSSIYLTMHVVLRI